MSSDETVKLSFLIEFLPDEACEHHVVGPFTLQAAKSVDGLWYAYWWDISDIEYWATGTAKQEAWLKLMQKMLPILAYNYAKLLYEKGIMSEGQFAFIAQRDREEEDVYE